ncbi:glycoside hydrolase family 64 protein [Prauserella cavernicola]|uniref:Beta-1,3-glucanase n=1 Tax=Prauserella cavernicola TaxID=2800127 RepID=A0A934V6E7_9PSEU|nr:glycoside hydrolase family 64 protein [Prauserella cavernicola]MBK1786639.1 beta-1,3-glucanase [Prauserella cavernicola]
MVSRRKFLGISAAALSAPLWARPLVAVASTAAAPDNLKFSLVNNSGATAYAYITGQHGAQADDGRPVFIKADGTAYFPPRPGGAEPEPLGEDCAIPVDGTTEVTVPRMFGARVYFVTEEKLEFQVVQGEGSNAAVVHPNFVSSEDANYGKNWTFAEFTLDQTQLYANISYVDFVAAPIGLKLDHAGGTQEVPGLPAGSIDNIASGLRDQGGPWTSCVQEAGGNVVRVLNPNHRPDDFAGYMEPYADEVWAKYSSETLIIDSQRGDVGILEGKVEGDELVFGSERFSKPNTIDIWGCNSGPFANNPGSDSEERKAIVPRLAAAFNRTTLLINNEQPHSEDPSTFYQHDPTNHYSRVVHENIPDGKGYAFAYDDVSANTGEDHSGKVNHGEPELLTVTLNAIR